MDRVDDPAVGDSDDLDHSRPEMVDVRQPAVRAEHHLRGAIGGGDPLERSTGLGADHRHVVLAAHRDPQSPAVGRDKALVG